MATAQVQTLVCDFCGKQAEGVVTFKLDDGNYQVDICGDDLKDLRARGRKPRRGRRPNSMKSTAGTTRKPRAKKPVPLAAAPATDGAAQVA